MPEADPSTSRRVLLAGTAAALAASSTLVMLESIRPDLGFGSQVHP